jgi:hypothetical protein
LASRIRREKVAGRRLERVRRQQRILGLANRRRQAFRRKPHVVDIRSGDRCLHNLEPIVLIVDREIRVEIDPLGVLPQQPRPQAVKCAH